jgi:acyl-CoA thioester hydrolase
MYQKQMIAGWGDMDFNSHMRNTAYLDKSGDVRMMYFAENGFPMSEFARLKIGPVIMKDEVEYFREVRLLENIAVDLTLAGLSKDGSRFALRNTFCRADGKPAAKVTSSGGWLDLSTRKLVPAPDALLEVIKGTPRAQDFRVLPASVDEREAAESSKWQSQS